MYLATIPILPKNIQKTHKIMYVGREIESFFKKTLLPNVGWLHTFAYLENESFKT